MYPVKRLGMSWVSAGLLSGVRCVEVVMAGCSVWNGQPHRRDPERGSCAAYCDADFHKGRTFALEGLIVAISELVTTGGTKFVNITGGEPAEFVDMDLILAINALGCEVRVETGGHVDNPVLYDEHNGLDLFVSVSPKPDLPCLLRVANEVRVVMGPPYMVGIRWETSALLALQERVRATAYYVTPLDSLINPEGSRATLLCQDGEEPDDVASAAFADSVRACKQFSAVHPTWRFDVPFLRLMGQH